MSSYYYTQKDIGILSQNEKIITVSIQLLNSSFKIIQEFGAALISMSLSIDANSDIRRTGTLNIFPEFDGYELTQESVLWVDRFIRIYLNFYHTPSKSYVPYCMGTFLVDTKTFTYDVDNDSLSITLLDMMSKLDGTYGGELGNETVVIHEGEIIRNAMISAIALADIDKYVIDDIGTYLSSSDNNNKVPYEISIDGGTDVLSVVKELRDLYPGWETFFDVYGIFYCQMIPTCKDDNNVITSDIFDKNIAIYSETRNYSYSSIKNVIQVYGEEYEDIDYFANNENSQFNNNVLNVNFEKFDKYENSMLLAIKLSCNNPSNFCININSFGIVPVVLSVNVPIPENYLVKDIVYILQYTNGSFEYVSSFQPKGLSVLVSKELTEGQKIQWYEKYNCTNTSFIIEPDNPFTVDKIGIKYTKNKDTREMQIITSDKEALDFAEYELWRKARLVNDITITCDIIPFLDVNQKFTYRHQKSGKINTYITKTIGIEISQDNAQMTITASEFNQLYPDIITDKR